jgi:hypothetical protein
MGFQGVAAGGYMYSRDFQTLRGFQSVDSMVFLKASESSMVFK